MDTMIRSNSNNRFVAMPRLVAVESAPAPAATAAHEPLTARRIFGTTADWNPFATDAAQRGPGPSILANFTDDEVTTARRVFGKAAADWAPASGHKLFMTSGQAA